MIMNAQDKRLDDLLGELEQILPNCLTLRGIAYFGGHWEMGCRPVSRRYVCRNVPLMIQGLALTEAIDWGEAMRGGLLEIMFEIGVLVNDCD